MGRRSHCVGSDPGLGTKLPQAAQHGKKTKESVDSQTLRRLGRLFFGKAKGVGGGKKLTADSKIKMACACNPS